MASDIFKETIKINNRDYEVVCYLDDKSPYLTTAVVSFYDALMVSNKLKESLKGDTNKRVACYLLEVAQGEVEESSRFMWSLIRQELGIRRGVTVVRHPYRGFVIIKGHAPFFEKGEV